MPVTDLKKCPTVYIYETDQNIQTHTNIYIYTHTHIHIIGTMRYP